MSIVRRAKRIWRKFFPWLRVLGLIGLIAYALNQESGPPRYEVTGRARLVDGDSLFVDGLEIRLKNIDAPEGRQTCKRNNKNWRCGQEATRRLERLINRRPIQCKGDQYDKYNRLLAFCSVNGRELNKWMVQKGWAVAFGGYRREEQAAKRARIGLWSSKFQRPRNWRADQRR